MCCEYRFRLISDPAAQERGEVKAANNAKTTSGLEAVSVADIGLTPKDIHDARLSVQTDSNCH